MIDRFGDHAESKLAADIGHDLQAAFSVTLKTVWRRAGFVRATTKEPGARGLDLFCNGEGLFAGLNRAGASDHANFRAAEGDFTEGRADSDYGGFRLYVATDQLIGLGYRNTFGDAGEKLEGNEVGRAGISSDADGSAARAGHGMRFVAKFFDSFADGPHLFVGGVRLHYNQHHSPLSEIELSSLLYAGRGLQTGLRYNRSDESGSKNFGRVHSSAVLPDKMHVLQFSYGRGVERKICAVRCRSVPGDCGDRAGSRHSGRTSGCD